MAARGGLRSLFGTRWGRWLLVALAIVTLVGCYVDLGPTGSFIAIPDLLFFGLALPIYAGWKRPRDLALYGLVAILIAIPFTSVLALNSAYQPSPAQDSATLAGASGPLLQGAVVAPYTGPTHSDYSFSVTVQPKDVPVNASPPLWVDLWVSTCPGATGPSDPYCTPGYPLIVQNHTFPGGLNATTVVTFVVPINESNLWSWQMAAAFQTVAGKANLTWVFLDTYAVQGPIVGPYTTLLGLAIEAFTISIFVPPGIVFFFALMVYMWFKAREARRKGQAAPGPGVSAPGPGGPPSADATPVGPVSRPEGACPNCGAVVYPNESQCWKCGAALRPSASAGAPLPSK